MEKASKDVILSVALQLDLPDLLSLCSINKRFNETICQQETFWMNKIRGDFPDYSHLKFPGTKRALYERLYKLDSLKEKLNLSGSLISIYNMEELNLSKEGLTRIPGEIGILKNLTYLNLNSNKLTSLPKELGKLIHLKELHLSNNRGLSKLPEELGNLRNLDDLYLSGTKVKKIPKGMGEDSEVFMVY